MAKADSIADEAYRAWELKEFSTAAELFLKAALIESNEADGRSKWASPDASLLYRLRAGFCLFEDGQTERSLDIVKEGMDYDWKAARLWGDRYDAEKCHICYILYYANLGDQSRYDFHIELAVRDGDKLDIGFPWSIPAKKQAITAALVMDDFENLSAWSKAIDDKSRRKNPELGLLCTQAKKAVAKNRKLK